MLKWKLNREIKKAGHWILINCKSPAFCVSLYSPIADYRIKILVSYYFILGRIMFEFRKKNNGVLWKLQDVPKKRVCGKYKIKYKI